MPVSVLQRAARLRSRKMPALTSKVVESADTPAKSEDYIRVNGLRLVRPYYFDFVCSVKKRWIGMSIIDVFTEEFASRPRSYYEEAFEDGRLRIEGGKSTATADTPLIDNHRMRHFIHRHEPPVLDLPVEVVGETDDLIAVHKPASVPVHVSGQYRKNTVMALLQLERPDLGRLFPVHRLDKPVSGLLLFAKNAAAAHDVCTQIMDLGAVRKAYIARVLGSFPSYPVTVDKHLAWDSRSKHAFLMESDGSVSQKQSLGIVPEAIQTQKLVAREAQTGFTLLSVAPDGKTSLVECQPKTGRTHQIRVHLSYLGYPVANDSQYGGPFKGPDQARTYAAAARQSQPDHSAQESPPVHSADALKLSCMETSASQQDLQATCQATNKRQRCEAESRVTSCSTAANTVSRNGQCDDMSDQTLQLQAGNSKPPTFELQAGNSEPQRNNSSNSQIGDDASFLVPADLQDDMCLNCPRLIPPGYTTDLHPLWLHAQRYTSDRWSFVCSKPQWANTNWTPAFLQ